MATKSAKKSSRKINFSKKAALIEDSILVILFLGRGEK